MKFLQRGRSAVVVRAPARLRGGMIWPGLVSVTFRPHAPAEIVALVKKAGLVGIEWGGDVHVPAGDVARAREVRELTEQAGLRVAAYGSYYRVGASEGAGLPFERVLETAVELGAPTIRVWPGTAASDATDDAARWRIVHELRRIGDLASRALVSISTEFHGGTLTDTNDSASQLLVEVDHTNVFTYWQPHNGEATPECVAGLRAVLPRVSNAHVFHWWPTAQERHPLADGAARWREFFAELERAPGDRYALLEFVAGDAPEAFLRDAATLKRWLAGDWGPAAGV
ncbi:MAG TPA: TIM barrel protein [Opitutaceae bacterium]